MKRFFISLLIIIGIITTVNSQSVIHPKKKQLSETEKIEYLINSIEQLENAQFYRNGSWYEAPVAASHLRMKLSKAGKRIKTASDFIDKIASSSSMTGEEYKIKLSDGQIITTNVFLNNKLKEIQ